MSPLKATFREQLGINSECLPVLSQSSARLLYAARRTDPTSASPTRYTICFD